MDQELEEKANQAQALNRRLDDNQRIADGARAALEELTQQLSLCLDDENDELARTVIKRKLEAERRLALLSGAGQSMAEDRERLEKLLTRYQEQRQQIEERYQMSLASEGLASERTGDRTTSLNTNLVSESEIEVALLQAKKRRVNTATQSNNN